MAFNLVACEIGECYAGGRELLHLELRRSRQGAWEVEVVDRDQQRRIRTQYDTEGAARAAVDVAYAYGRQFGSWRVQRAVGYQPSPSPTSPEVEG